MKNNHYKTIESEVMCEQIIEKSKFIGYLCPIDSEDDAKEYIRKIKKEHPKATHHCTAYIIDDIERSNDDGEPSSSAGLPMLETLRGNNLSRVVAVVVRYYGGTLLGVGGLIRAYSSSVTLTVKSATLLIPKKIYQYELSFPYEYINDVETIMAKIGTVTNRFYDSLVRYDVEIENPELLNEFNDITRGMMIKKECGTAIVYIKENIDE